MTRLQSAVVALACAMAVPASAQPAYSTFPIQNGPNFSSIAEAPDGSIWATSYNQYALYHLQNDGSIIGVFQIPESQTHPSGLVVTADGTVWFVEYSVNAIGRRTPEGTFASYPLPIGRFPVDIVAGLDGALWFTEQQDASSNTSHIGRISTDGQISEFPFDQPGYDSVSLTTGADGAIWYGTRRTDYLFDSNGDCVLSPFGFCQQVNVGSLVRMGLDGVITNSYPLPFDGSVERVLAAPDGSIWFGTSNSQQAQVYVGRLDAASPGCSLENPCTDFYPVVDVFDGISSLANGVDGATWYSTYGNLLGRISVSGAGCSPTAPCDGQWVGPLVDYSAIMDLAAVADGSLWIAGYDHITKATIVNTPAGSGISVSATDGNGTSAALSFQQVVVSGTTTLTSSTTGPTLPSGFVLGTPAQFLDVVTTSHYSGAIDICVNYGSTVFVSPSTLRLLHFENGAWQDVTRSLDTGNHTICGSVSSLSPFVVAEQANRPPVAQEGTVTTPRNTAVNGVVRATDPDGDQLSYAASRAAAHGVVVIADSGQFVYAPAPGYSGSDSFAFTVQDGRGGSAVGVVTVEVTATNNPPNCALASPSQAVIWPPNHDMVPIAIQGVSDPDGDAATIRVTGIFSDEPTNGSRNGSTSIDASGIGTTTAMVRAERSGNRNGRVYYIRFTATDPSGARCAGEVRVAVPRSLRTAAIGDGPRFDATRRGGGADEDEHHGCGDRDDYRHGSKGKADHDRKFHGRGHGDDYREDGRALD